MDAEQAVERARVLFLDDGHAYGCAETSFIVLKEAFGLPDPNDSSAAMPLNGGVAYTGGVCGAITGAAIAVGTLAGERFIEHRLAKSRAREEIARALDEFRERFGAVECLSLLGHSIRTPEEHQAFIDSGMWRETCMAQVEFVVERLAELPDDPGWQRGDG